MEHERALRLAWSGERACRHSNHDEKSTFDATEACGRGNEGLVRVLDMGFAFAEHWMARRHARRTCLASGRLQAMFGVQRP
jgi:hypothetical protein